MFLNKFLVTVSSSELSAFEHRKLWCLQTLCWLHGERSLPIGLLVIFCNVGRSGTIFLRREELVQNFNKREVLIGTKS